MDETYEPDIKWYGNTPVMTDLWDHVRVTGIESVEPPLTEIDALSKSSYAAIQAKVNGSIVDFYNTTKTGYGVDTTINSAIDVKDTFDMQKMRDMLMAYYDKQKAKIDAFNYKTVHGTNFENVIFDDYNYNWNVPGVKS